jgi:hypothetical protein
VIGRHDTTPSAEQVRAAADDLVRRSAATHGMVERAIRALAAWVIAIIFAAWFAHLIASWAECDPSVVMCLAATAVPLRSTWWARLRRRLRLELALANYRHAIKRVEIAEDWLIEDQLALASAQADVRELRDLVKQLDRQP